MKRFFTTVYTEPDNVIEKVRLKLKEKIANQTPCVMTNTTRTEANWREYAKRVEFGGTYYIIDMGIDRVKYRDLIEENFAPKKEKRILVLCLYFRRCDNNIRDIYHI